MLLLDASPFLGGEERWKTIYKLPVDTLKKKKEKRKLKSAAPLLFLFFFHVVVVVDIFFKIHNNNSSYESGFRGKDFSVFLSHATFSPATIR